MNRPEQSEAKLDEDFVFYLSFATAAHQSVRGHDKSLCEAWLRKLCAEPVTGLTAKKARNAYMFNLVMQIQEGYIKQPFSSPPPVGKLKSPGEVFPTDMPTAKEPAWLQAIARGTGADLIHSSKDGRMYMTSRYLENGRGAMSYLAISVADQEPLFLQPSEAVSEVRVKASSSGNESCTSSASEESDSEDETVKYRKKSAKARKAKAKVPAAASKHKDTRPSRVHVPSATEPSRSPSAKSTRVSVTINTAAPIPEMAREQTPWRGKELPKIFKLAKTASHRSEPIAVSSEVRVSFETADPSAEGEAPTLARPEATKWGEKPSKTPVKKHSKIPEQIPSKSSIKRGPALKQESGLKKMPPDKKMIPQKFLPPPQRKVPADPRETIFSEPAISVKFQPKLSHSGVRPGAKGSEHKVEVAVSYNSPHHTSESDSASSSGSEESDDSEDTLRDIESSLQELFAKRGTAAERWEILRVFDDLIAHITVVLAGQDKPQPVLMTLLKKLAIRYTHLVRVMPIKSRLLWLIKLLREKLISQRTQFVMRMTKLDCIQNAVLGKKKPTAAETWREHFKVRDVDPAWRAEVARMPSPENMKLLKKHYHPVVINRFLYYLVQEKILILKRYQAKHSRKEQFMKDELQQEMKTGFENYNNVRMACEEVMRVVNQLMYVLDGAKVDDDTEMDQLSQKKMENRYAAMSRDIQEQLNKANVTFRYESLRSRELCNMIEAEKRKMEQLEATFAESMRRKEAHKKALEEEIIWLSRQIDAHSQKIVDINTYL